MKYFHLVIIFFLMLVNNSSFAHEDNQKEISVKSEIFQKNIDTNLPNTIPYKKDSYEYSSAFIGFTFVIGILILLAFFLSKHKAKLSKLGILSVKQGEHLAILDRQKLHGDNIVYLIEVDKKKYLLVVGHTYASISETEA